MGGVLNTLKAVYPVGAIYLSTVATDPATLFGFGVWEQIKDTFLLASGDTYTAGNTGGEATHQLTKDELPDHYHYIATTGSGGYTLPPWTVRITSGSYTTSGADGAEGAACGYTGGGYQIYGVAHNNMPPYLAVYIWQRVE